MKRVFSWVLALVLAAGLLPIIVSTNETIAATHYNWKGADAVSAGTAFTLIIGIDGSLWGWGLNTYGQLGDGTDVRRRTPVQIGVSTDWVDVAAGRDHSLALKSDGSLWSWGRNNNGRLGDGTNSERNTPVQVGTSTDWADVAAGRVHTLAIKTDGSLWAWGYTAESLASVPLQTVALLLCKSEHRQIGARFLPETEVVSPSRSTAAFGHGDATSMAVSATALPPIVRYPRKSERRPIGLAFQQMIVLPPLR